MTRDLFSDLEIAAFRAGITPRTKESIAWFRQKAGALGKLTGSTVFNQEQIKMRASLRNPLGNMYCFIIMQNIEQSCHTLMHSH
tara:strand:- start:80 stop:331 length:252 start_codon:yes stop_codon:yes gene_type:complete